MISGNNPHFIKKETALKRKTNRQRLISQFVILPFFISFFLSFPLTLFASSTTPTQSETRLKSWKKQVELSAISPFKNLPWRSIGPSFLGGRVETIDAVPGTATIYAGFGAGNIWKSENDGLTWAPIFDSESTFTIGDLAISKSDPNIVWVGTGENLMARSSFAGTGVFRSTDSGMSWEHKGLAETHHIGRVVIHPDDPDTVYVAALGHNYTDNPERGLFKTTDGGITWSKVLYISEKAGVVDVVMDPSDPDILYAASHERDRKAWNNISSGPGTGLFKTTDGGLTWQQLANGFPAGPHIGRIGLDISRSNPQILYALVSNQTPIEEPAEEGARPRQAGVEVYRSANGGASWEKRPMANEEFLLHSFGDIRVSPEDPDIIYTLGVNLLSSRDGGSTFNQLEGTVIHLYDHPTRALHLDQHDLWIDPTRPDRLILGNDGGIYLSNDRGTHWLHLNNIPAGEFYAVSVDMADPFNIYGGTQDNAAVFGPSNRFPEDGIEDPWQNVWIDLWGGGDSYITLVDPTNPHIIYFEQQFGDFQRKDMTTGIKKLIRPRAGEGEPELRYNWMSPFIISHHNPLTLYFGANRVFKSLNRGDDWQCISPDLTTNPGPEKQGNVPYGTITSISESPLKSGLIYAGTDDGQVHVTRNDGFTWADITAGLPDKWVSRVEASLHDLDTVYVSLTGYREDDFTAYLFMSSDAGKTWLSLVSGLPDESINVVREDPHHPGRLYIGTDHGGIYISLDSGMTWHSLRNNLPMTAIHDIAVHPRDHKLVIGTHGRSVFVLDAQLIHLFSEEIAQKDIHLFPIRPARLPQSRDYRGDWALETKQDAVFQFYLKEAGQMELTVLDSDGETIKTLSVSGSRGFNTTVWDLSPKAHTREPAVYERPSILVRSGEYTIQITVGDKMIEDKFQVEAAEGSFHPGP